MSHNSEAVFANAASAAAWKYAGGGRRNNNLAVTFSTQNKCLKRGAMTWEVSFLKGLASCCLETCLSCHHTGINPPSLPKTSKNPGFLLVGMNLIACLEWI